MHGLGADLPGDGVEAARSLYRPDLIDNSRLLIDERRSPMGRRQGRLIYRVKIKKVRRLVRVRADHWPRSHLLVGPCLSTAALGEIERMSACDFRIKAHGFTR